jgi:hypothetical protein
MEIHPPHNAVHTWKDALTHIALITVGVFIALSFEGVATWREHRALVREARANLMTEVDDNRKELQRALKKLDETDAQLQHDLAVTAALIGRTPIKGGKSIDLETDLANLQDASHTTAEATGAFGLMDYAEVKKFAGVYSWQQQFLAAQRDLVTDLTHALPGAMAVTGTHTPGAAMLVDGPHTASMQELESLQQGLRQCVTSALVERQMAKSLSAAYDRVLAQP